MRWKQHGRPRVVSAVAILGLSIAILLAGCGDDPDDAAATSTTTTGGSSTETSATETSTSTTTSSTTTSSTSSTTTTIGGATTVTVFFSVGDGSDCAEVDAFGRTVAAGADPIAAAFAELVAGPTSDEISAGAGSFFSTETAGVVHRVSLTDGLLLIDFTDISSLIPNASTSCGSEALLAQLNGTALQFPEVGRVRYQLFGSCDEFGNWLQRECVEFDRDGQKPVTSTNERASGSGCTPSSGDGLPDGRWFGFVAEAEAGQLSFDLACWFSGTAAIAAAAEDGEESPPPNDYHIRNANDQLRALTVDPAAEVSWLPNPGDPASQEIVDYGTWVDAQPGRSYRPGIWLIVDDGRIASIEEQYVP